MRRHSMNDGILSSPVEKLNPYFTKTYSRNSLSVRSDSFIAPKSPIKLNPGSTLSPKRNLSVTSLDFDSTTKSSPKKSKSNFKSDIDVFDFKSDSHFVKQESDESPYSEELEGKKTETFCYSLLKGASKTSSVNPSFSSRKNLTKKIQFLPQNLQNKCTNLVRYDKFRKPATPPDTASKFTAFKQPLSPLKSPSKRSISPFKGPGSSSLVESTSYVVSKQTNHENYNKSDYSVSPTTTSVTIATNRSINTSKSDSISSTESKKSLSLLNDSDLIAHVIDGK